MIRALRLLALFTALFVVSVRCLSSFPLAAACAALPGPGSEQLCTAADDPREEDTLAATVIDDADDDADGLIAPREPRIRLLTHGETSGADCSALAPERALPSHARGLERPPRA